MFVAAVATGAYYVAAIIVNTDQTIKYNTLNLSLKSKYLFILLYYLSSSVFTMITVDMDTRRYAVPTGYYNNIYYLIQYYSLRRQLISEYATAACDLSSMKESAFR